MGTVAMAILRAVYKREFTLHTHRHRSDLLLCILNLCTIQALTGDGDVFVKAGGTVIRRDLREGEQLRISSGCLVAFSQGIDYGMLVS